jgi:hypothetical protein
MKKLNIKVNVDSATTVSDKLLSGSKTNIS